MSSLDRILPFLRPIEDLLRDPTVTEGGAELKTGARVKVVRVTAGNVLVVEKV